MESKKWCFLYFYIVFAIFVSCSLLVIIIDPFFHYHAPLKGLSYKMWNERYFNSGIVKNFEYDAMITGSSLTENFKTTECNKLFDVRSIKVPYAGGSYNMVNQLVELSVKENPNLNIVIRGLDYHRLGEDKDLFDESDFPTYLYDDNVMNDIQYLLNGEVLTKYVFGAFERTLEKKEMVSFDEYNNWANNYEYGENAVKDTYKRPIKFDKEIGYGVSEQEKLEGNIQQNVIAIAEEYPEIEFYYFLAPHSIYYWDRLNQKGEINKQLLMEKQAIEMMLEVDNIHLYAFNDEFEMICNLDNFKDWEHYSEEINSWILKEMAADRHLLTKENYLEYCEKVSLFYNAYDYEKLFEEEDR